MMAVCLRPARLRTGTGCLHQKSHQVLPQQNTERCRTPFLWPFHQLNPVLFSNVWLDETASKILNPHRRQPAGDQTTAELQLRYLTYNPSTSLGIWFSLIRKPNTNRSEPAYTKSHRKRVGRLDWIDTHIANRIALLVMP